MNRVSKRPPAAGLSPISSTVIGSIKLFSPSRRNIIRGAVASARKGEFYTAQLEAIRDNIYEEDMRAAATILESEGGLRKRTVCGLSQRSITRAHNLQSKKPNLEIAYAAGFIGTWKAEAIQALGTIGVLSRLTEVPPDDALEGLLHAAQKWGASNYISYKIAYAKEFFQLTDRDHSILDKIDSTIGHNESPMMQYYAFENIMPRLSLFSVARRHTNILRDHIKHDFRRYHSLNNLAATPFSHEDCAGFVLRAVETSLIDTVNCFWTILNLRARLPEAFEAIERNLDPDILQELINMQNEVAALPPPTLLTPAVGYSDDSKIEEKQTHSDEEERSLGLYRRSSVFLEYPKLCMYRNDLDMVIGQRLLAPLLGEDIVWHAKPYYDYATLQRDDGSFLLEYHETSQVIIDTFYRTYLFMRFIQDPTNLSLLSSNDVQYIFNSTTRLDNLLLEKELKTMHLNASDEARAIISVLALALYRSKSSDPDIDFDFREHLEDFIIKNFGGKIPDFIEYLAPKSPGVAHYIASSLDEITLQKMYQIIGSPIAAQNARRDILTSVGVHLNNIDYIVEAEAIETRAKVAKLKNYFDASRMFVDSVAMKKWLSSNPSAYTEQFKELLPSIVARLTTSRSIITSTGKEAKIDIVQITATDEYLVERMAVEAFREFCTNNEFGIESYLGRRIRHNTLHGVMTKGVDAVLQNPQYQPIITATPFGRALGSWERGYKIFIERMRREFLQFRSEGKPNALFNSEIDLSDPATISNLQQLLQNLRRSGPEMLEELIVSFCWRQIAPQLENASRHIRVRMTQDITQQLDQAVQRFNGPEELKAKIELEGGLALVFTQVASWFQVPQTGFVPASIEEICNIIDIEHNRSAAPTIVISDQQNVKYYGISVHRLYDCLAALLQNAFKHGKKGTDIVVTSRSTPIDKTNLHVLDISVRSLLPDDDATECTARVSAALTSSETGRDMVTEGYSGIKKVKFITRLNEGVSTVSFESDDSGIDLRFCLKAEVADLEPSH